MRKLLILITLCLPVVVWAQDTRKITGRVLEAASGEPLPGATVFIDPDAPEAKEYNPAGTVTDVSGKFELTLPASIRYVVVSFIGYEALKADISGKTEFTFRLKEEVSQLDEVVVTGYQQIEKRKVTSAITTVQADDIKSIGVASIDQMLEGQVAGLMSTPTNGAPGAPAKMRIRSTVSLSGSTDPLWVLDGMILEGNDIPKDFGDKDNIDELQNTSIGGVNPADIESITILKDAAATAIYGSRAANGVIVIESKTPKPGRIWVTYGGELRIEAPDMTGYNLMNAREKIDAELQSGLYTYGGETVEKWQLYQSKLREVLAGVNTYWLDKPLQTAFQQRHTVTLEGGDEALRYRMYVGYNSSPGVMKDSKRDVLTGSLDFQYRLKKVLLKNSITLDNSVANESPWGSFSEYTRLNPYLRPYGENGEIQKRLDNFEGVGGESSYLNPMYNTTFNSKDQSKNFTVRELFKVEYNPTNELRFEGAFNLSKSVGHRDIFRPAQHTLFDNVTDPTLRGDYRRSQSEAVNWGIDLTGSWNKQLEDHYLTANARMSVLENNSETYGNYVTGFPNDNMDNLLFGKKYNEKVTGDERTTRSIGWVAAGGYSYKYKYSFDFNIRLDLSLIHI